jgi:hypothetical protein
MLPLQGLMNTGLRFLGRCPRLLHCAPLGLFQTASKYCWMAVVVLNGLLPLANGLTLSAASCGLVLDSFVVGSAGQLFG